ncbi:MAG: VWA domain-containing protein, partial [Thiomicrorhabdus sp.]|nr:VWA domain-containing protein [Thiomicrorhabdus sp.]
QLKTQSRLQVAHPLLDLFLAQTEHHSKPPSLFSWAKLGLNILRGLILIALAITLAQPEKIQTIPSETPQKTVRDIVFVIESSASLLLPDYQINGQPESRMNVVKKVLDQFIAELEGNRFGFTIYADHAYTLMPLTADQTAARLHLNRLKPYLAGRLDTAMGEALGLALKQTDLKASSANPNFIPPLKRIIVLISDGLSRPSTLPISEAINYAQTLNVPIYTVGIGSHSHTSDQRQYTGLLYQPLESQSLKTIAAATQAHYFQVGSGNDLSQVLQKINAAEGVPFTTPPNQTQRISLYHYPLSVAVATLCLYLLLSLIWARHRLSQKELA